MSLPAITHTRTITRAVFNPNVIILQLIDGLSPDHQMRKICFNASVWSAQLRVLQRGDWETTYPIPASSKPARFQYYLSRHYLLNAAMNRLGEICVDHHLDPSNCSFWEGVEDLKKVSFQASRDENLKREAEVIIA